MTAGLRRLKVGLALGGGSALGWAQIGVINELIDQGIIIDVVAGTSIGAVVGACFAAGKLDLLEQFALGLNRRRVFGLMDPSLGGTALLGGGRLKRRLTRELGGLRIEALATRYAAIATEFGTGREVCLAEGDLVEAVRASYALPGIFEPVPVAGRWLFDGVMSNPVPVSVVRALGADLVIAVNLSSGSTEHSAELVQESELAHSMADFDELARDLVVEAERLPLQRKTRRRFPFMRRRLFTRRPNGAPGIATVMVSAFSIAQERISHSRLALEPPDVMINARLADVGLFDFHRARDLIAHGRAVARRAIPDIEARLAVRDA